MEGDINIKYHWLTWLGNAGNGKLPVENIVGEKMVDKFSALKFIYIYRYIVFDASHQDNLKNHKQKNINLYYLILLSAEWSATFLKCASNALKNIASVSVSFRFNLSVSLFASLSSFKTILFEIHNI